MGLDFTIRKSDWLKVHHEKNSDGVRVHHEKKSEGMRFHHKKGRWDEKSPSERAMG